LRSLEGTTLQKGNAEKKDINVRQQEGIRKTKLIERTAESEIRKGNENYSKIRRKEIKFIPRKKEVIRKNS